MMDDWTLDEALQLIRAIQPESRRYGYHVTLGGGVLNTGSSRKDLDLYFLPMDNPKYKPDPEGVVTWLTLLWDAPDVIPDYGTVSEKKKKIPKDYAEYVQMLRIPGAPEDPVVKPPASPSAYKYKLKFMRPGDDRIDVFIIA